MNAKVLITFGILATMVLGVFIYAQIERSKRPKDSQGRPCPLEGCPRPMSW